ncbi:hypothetical protein evm_005092 [Chilo suppressalis]|nr:hypothetical protein evm_005092 [Chilo suppressalis]
MIPAKANLLLKSYFFKFMILRTFKTLILPKVIILDERNYKIKIWAMLRPSSDEQQGRVTSAGDPMISQIANQRYRREIFEKCCKAARYDAFKWIRVGL